MPKYAPNAKDLASRDVVSRAIQMEVNAGRGVGSHKDHAHLHLEHLDAEIINEKLPGIAETAQIFAGVDVTKDPIPVIPTVHYNMLRLIFFFQRFNSIKNANGDINPSEIRDSMQRAMQKYAPVYRDQETMDKGIEIMKGLYNDFSNIKLSDTSLIWNTDFNKPRT